MKRTKDKYSPKLIEMENLRRSTNTELEELDKHMGFGLWLITVKPPTQPVLFVRQGGKSLLLLGRNTTDEKQKETHEKSHYSSIFKNSDKKEILQATEEKQQGKRMQQTAHGFLIQARRRWDIAEH